MITERELMQAIRECEAEPITLSKVGKLADFYIIYDHLFGDPFNAEYSYGSSAEKTINTDSGSEFLKTINGKSSDKVLTLMDEFMEAIKSLHPRMYSGFIEKLRDL